MAHGRRTMTRFHTSPPLVQRVLLLPSIVCPVHPCCLSTGCPRISRLTFTKLCFTNLRIQVNYTDKYPDDKSAWVSLFPDIVGRLGIWHWLHRMSETLRKHHKDFHPACTALSKTVFVVGVCPCVTPLKFHTLHF
jgi:hypothetical protein